MKSTLITWLPAAALAFAAGSAWAELPQPSKKTTDKIEKPAMKAEAATRRGAHRAGNAMDRGANATGNAISKTGRKLGLPAAPPVRPVRNDPHAPG